MTKIKDESKSEFLAKIKRVLIARKTSIIEDIETRMKDAGASDANGIDAIDAAMNTIEDEYTLNYVSNCLELLEEIEDALKRIDKGEYGNCVECKVQIDIERLREVPSTNMCVKCRERYERKSGKFPKV